MARRVVCGVTTYASYSGEAAAPGQPGIERYGLPVLSDGRAKSKGDYTFFRSCSGSLPYWLYTCPQFVLLRDFVDEHSRDGGFTSRFDGRAHHAAAHSRLVTDLQRAYADYARYPMTEVWPPDTTALYRRLLLNMVAQEAITAPALTSLRKGFKEALNGHLAGFQQRDPDRKLYCNPTSDAGSHLILKCGDKWCRTYVVGAYAGLREVGGAGYNQFARGEFDMALRQSNRVDIGGAHNLRRLQRTMEATVDKIHEELTAEIQRQTP